MGPNQSELALYWWTQPSLCRSNTKSVLSDKKEHQGAAMQVCHQHCMSALQATLAIGRLFEPQHLLFSCLRIFTNYKTDLAAELVGQIDVTQAVNALSRL